MKRDSGRDCVDPEASEHEERNDEENISLLLTDSTYVENSLLEEKDEHIVATSPYSKVYVVSALACLLLGLRWAIDGQGGGRPKEHAPVSNGERDAHVGGEYDHFVDPPRYKVGSWISDSWITPDGWRLRSPEELLDFYSKRSVLWIGDSTGRRSGMTLYGLLNHTTTRLERETHQVAIDRTEIDSSRVINVNKKVITEFCPRYNSSMEGRGSIICRPMPGSNGTREFLYQDDTCLSELEGFFRREVREPYLTASVDVIVIAVGIWEIVRAYDCSVPNRTQGEEEDGILASLDEIQSKGVRVVWRTSGYTAGNEFGLPANQTREMNERMMDKIDNQVAKYRSQEHVQSNLTYVNFGGAVEARSFGDHRISGDIRPHYGLEARLAFIQMLTNVLQELDEVFEG